MADGRGLREYLGQKASAMRAAAVARPAGADWAETVEATVVADDLTGVRKLRIRDWLLIGDSGPAFGGWSLGPSSPELLCGVIGTCLTHTYLIGAAMRGIPLDRVAVRVTARNNDARFVGVPTDELPLPFDLTAHVDVRADGVAETLLAELHAYVRESCPLTQLIKTANELRIVMAPVTGTADDA
ncbi:MAG: OsmC family protein [Dehalococcoidia bacterium]